ncbi:MAG: hypothetical protein AABX71_01065 [Nanoarchaeota archaeon]
MNSKQKNLLDLKHSLYSTKASLFFSIGVGGAIALFFGIKQLIEEAALPILVANIWFIIFVWVSIIHFNKCEKIQKKIKDSL